MDKQDREFQKKDHERIVHFLNKYFVPYCEKHEYPLNLNLALFLIIAKDCFGKSQDEISDKYEVALQSTINRTSTSQSKISRDIDKLNVKLKTFCDENKISPPIQIYNHYLTSDKERRYAGFFFACAKTSSTDNNTAYDILSIKKARQKTNLPALPLKLKYFRDMRDVLKWDEENIEPVWFRKSGLLAVDFRAGYVYERKEFLGELDELISKNKISILEGDGGSGKSVLIRNYAYNLILKQPDSPIYHFSFKTDSQIVDFHDFAAVLNSVTGLVIIEDIHLNTPEMQYVVEAFNNQKEISLVLTCHESFRKNLLNNRSQTHEKSPTLSLISNNGSRHYNDAREIVDCYCNKQKKDLDAKAKQAIVIACNNDLWLLSFALKGYSNDTDFSSWIKDGAIQDLHEIENHPVYKCNPEILVALSPLYKNEVLTAQSFLVRHLGFNRIEIEKLVGIGKITQHFIDNEVFYGIAHSSLAKAYYDYGCKYRDCIKYSNEEEFIYQYAISGSSNSLTAIVSNRDLCRKLCKTLQQSGEIKSVLKSEKSLSMISFCLNFDMLRYPLNNEILDVLSEKVQHGDFYYASDLLTPLGVDPSNHGSKIIHRLNIKEIANRISSTTDFHGANNLLFSFSIIEKDKAEELCSLLDTKQLSTQINNTHESLCSCVFVSTINRNCNIIGKKLWDQIDKQVIADKLMKDDYFPNIFSACGFLFSSDVSMGAELWQNLKLKTLAKTINKIQDVSILIECIKGMFRIFDRYDLEYEGFLSLQAFLHEGDQWELVQNQFYEMIQITQLKQLINKCSNVEESVILLGVVCATNAERGELLLHEIGIHSVLSMLKSVSLNFTMYHYIQHILPFYPIIDVEWMDISKIAENLIKAAFLSDIDKCIDTIGMMSPDLAEQLCEQLNLQMLADKIKPYRRYQVARDIIATICARNIIVGEKLKNMLDEN